MTSGLSAEELEQLRSVLKKYPEIDSAYIYGSRALGNYKKGSDIDIAIKGKNLSFDISSKLHYELEEETLLPYFFDITDYHSIKNPSLIEHINRVGQKIYERELN